jgi:hypothetical protein
VLEISSCTPTSYPTKGPTAPISASLIAKIDFCWCVAACVGAWLACCVLGEDHGPGDIGYSNATMKFEQFLYCAWCCLYP